MNIGLNDPAPQFGQFFINAYGAYGAYGRERMSVN